MRNILNLSVPAGLKQEMEREAKAGGFMSVSEFFRAIMREREEARLLRDIEISRQEYRAGKAKMLRSLKDLR